MNTQLLRIEQAREVLATGKQTIGPIPPVQRSYFAAVDKILAQAILCAKGEASPIDLEHAVNALRQRFPKLFPEPPAWLTAGEVEQLRAMVKAASRQSPDAVKQLTQWLTAEFPKARGRRPTLTAIYREAADLRAAGNTWIAITRKLCPNSSVGHVCDDGCKARIRLGATRLMQESS